MDARWLVPQRAGEQRSNTATGITLHRDAYLAPVNEVLNVSRLRRLITASKLATPTRIREHPHSGRNKLFLVGETGEDWSWVAKSDAHGAERFFYRHVGPHAPFTANCQLLPDGETLFLEYVEGLPISEVVQENPALALEKLSELGPVLAALHALPTDGAPHARPALPDLDPIDVRVLLSLPPPAVQLLEFIQSREVLCAGVLEANAARTAFVHGDIKSDNIVLGAGGPIILDWELSGLGEPAWDLGSVIGSMLAIWIDTCDFGIDKPEDWFEGARVPFEDLSDAARCFIADYLELSTQLVANRSTLALHACSWLVGRSFAEAIFGAREDPRHKVRLVFAEGLVRNPAGLFGPLVW